MTDPIDFIVTRPSFYLAPCPGFDDPQRRNPTRILARSPAEAAARLAGTCYHEVAFDVQDPACLSTVSRFMRTPRSLELMRVRVAGEVSPVFDVLREQGWRIEKKMISGVQCTDIMALDFEETNVSHYDPESSDPLYGEPMSAAHLEYARRWLVRMSRYGGESIVPRTAGSIALIAEGNGSTPVRTAERLDAGDVVYTPAATFVLLADREGCEHAGRWPVTTRVKPEMHVYSGGVIDVDGKLNSPALEKLQAAGWGITQRQAGPGEVHTALTPPSGVSVRGTPEMLQALGFNLGAGIKAALGLPGAALPGELHPAALQTFGCFVNLGSRDAGLHPVARVADCEGKASQREAVLPPEHRIARMGKPREQDETQEMLAFHIYEEERVALRGVLRSWVRLALLPSPMVLELLKRLEAAAPVPQLGTPVFETKHGLVYFYADGEDAPCSRFTLGISGKVFREEDQDVEDFTLHCDGEYHDGFRMLHEVAETFPVVAASVEDWKRDHLVPFDVVLKLARELCREAAEARAGKLNIRIVQSSAIGKCPVSSFEATHYRDDGSCKCREICERCAGDGVFDTGAGEVVTCPKCHGEKYT